MCVFSYEEEDNQPGITKFYLGIVPVHNNDYGSLNPDKINQNFDVKAVKNASYSVPFGKIPLSTTQAFRLAIKAERMCGTWEFLSSNIDPDVYDISMTSTTCPSAAHRLSKFAEGCERKQRLAPFSINCQIFNFESLKRVNKQKMNTSQQPDGTLIVMVRRSRDILNNLICNEN